MRTHLVALALGMTLLLSNVSYSHERAPPIFRVLEIRDGNSPVLPVFPTAINDLGSTTGLAFSPEGLEVPFLWSHGRLFEIDSNEVLRPAQALGINERGQVVGVGNRLDETGLDTVRGFVWTHGKLTDIGDLPGGIKWSVAYAINNRGEVVGASESANGREAVLWSHGHLMSLGDLPGGETFAHAFAINDWGVIVGQGRTLTGDEAFIWREGVMSALPVPTGTTFSWAVAINNFNVAAGYLRIGSTTFPVIWKGNTFKILPFLSSDLQWVAHADGINNRGDVVGAHAAVVGGTPDTPRFGIPVATLWHEGVAYNLNDLIAQDDPLKACVDLQLTQAINDRGQIAVEGVNKCENSGSIVFVLSPIRRRD